MGAEKLKERRPLSEVILGMTSKCLLALNVQSQPKIVWPQNLIVGKAYVAQLERSGALPAGADYFHENLDCQSGKAGASRKTGRSQGNGRRSRQRRREVEIRDGCGPDAGFGGYP